VVQGSFGVIVAAKAVGHSGSQSRFEIEAFDGASRECFTGFEPVEQQVAMLTNCARQFGKWLKPAPRGVLDPQVEELACPAGRFVLPELLKRLLEQVGAGCGVVDLYQLVESAELPFDGHRWTAGTQLHDTAHFEPMLLVRTFSPPLSSLSRPLPQNEGIPQINCHIQCDSGFTERQQI